MILSSAAIAELIHYAREDLPYETGGIIGRYRSAGRFVFFVRRVRNVHVSPEHNYAGEAQETIAAITEFQELGAEVLCAWHSHPTGPWCPSAIDEDLYHPSDRLVIVSFNSDDVAEVNAFEMYPGNSSMVKIMEIE